MYVHVPELGSISIFVVNHNIMKYHYSPVANFAIPVYWNTGISNMVPCIYDILLSCCVWLHVLLRPQLIIIKEPFLVTPSIFNHFKVKAHGLSQKFHQAMHCLYIHLCNNIYTEKTNVLPYPTLPYPTAYSIPYPILQFILPYPMAYL